MISSVCVCVCQFVCGRVRSREEIRKKKTRGVIFLDVSFFSQREEEKRMIIIVLICEWCGDEWTKWKKNILCLLFDRSFSWPSTAAVLFSKKHIFRCVCVVECVREEDYCIVIRFMSFVSGLMSVLVSCGQSEDRKSSNIARARRSRSARCDEKR